MNKKPCFERYIVWFFVPGSIGPWKIRLKIWTYIIVVVTLIYSAWFISLGVAYEMYLLICFYGALAFFSLLLLIGRLFGWWSLYKIFIVGSFIITQWSQIGFGVFWIIYGASNGRIGLDYNSSWRWSTIPQAMQSSTEIIIFGCLLVVARIIFVVLEGIVYSDFHNEYLDLPERDIESERRRQPIILRCCL
ncbi:hypothetical protein M3Y94_00647700 [Aphelenchoides besseyi]|nr:hypothetical protein M3Y94_00647700 [Aphelenchoides besseyi]KAI6231091.1 hypothetical protein M3Y95_00344700 [Aphelenchoides besseyi]